MTAMDAARLGLDMMTHYYGLFESMLKDYSIQDWPLNYNYNDEQHRFGNVARLWNQIHEPGSEKWKATIKEFVDLGFGIDPTMTIYEASRDLTRAQNQPWFRDYLHPTLEDYFKPDPSNHGSYFLGWTTTDEAFWRENYRIWMNAVREFGRKGGLIGAGEDAGFIYQMYGYGLIRELELQQEAGFHPLKVIEHATLNNARILGKADRLGRVRTGHAADLIVVNGNPLENLKLLYPTGVDIVQDGKTVHTGGVEWTIKDGIPYHGPRLMREVKEMVAQARSQRAVKTGS